MEFLKWERAREWCQMKKENSGIIVSTVERKEKKRIKEREKEFNNTLDKTV